MSGDRWTSRARRTLRGAGALAGGALLVALAAPPQASAAIPAPNAAIAAHDHATAGRNWHVEVEVSSTSKSLRTLVLYVQECDQTVLARNVVIALPDGVVVAEGDLGAGGGEGPGRWKVTGQFTEPTHLEGTYEVTSPNCTTGPRPFHGHAGGHGSTSGTPVGSFPDIPKASDVRRREARRLWHHTVASAKSPRFSTYRSARANRYVRVPKARTRPLVFHLRRKDYERDDHVLDFLRPESLVYWWPVQGQPVLIAFMYRAPADETPEFGSPLIGWHQHVTATGKVGDSQMTHVWLTGDLRSAYANCLPRQALELAIPGFRFSPPGEPMTHASELCPEPLPPSDGA